MSNSDQAQMDALSEAIETCNGVVAFASAISTEELPVGQSKVSMWKVRRRVPPEYAPAIFRATLARGKPVACERICPQVDWEALRLMAAPEERAAATAETTSES